MTETVLDASAIIAIFKQEPGWERVVPLLEAARISAVNLTEVATLLARMDKSYREVVEHLDGLQLTVMDFDRSRAIAAGLIEPRTRHRGLSLGDRACLALGIELGMPVVTCDRAWRDLDVGVEVRMFR
jgi:PIN domain nuclease of toxin-antitoxin system